jgi:hypothetical protein
LPVHHQPRLGVVGSEVLARDAQHAPGASGGSGPHQASKGRRRPR